MKKVSPFMWSVGISSALVWLIMNPENRKSIKSAIRQVRTAKSVRDDGIHYI